MKTSYSADFGYNNFGSINNKNYNTMTDYAVGIDMINKFHEYNKTKAQNYVDQIFKLNTYNKALAQITSIGTAIKLLEIDEYDVDDIAKEMAKKAGGKVPAKASDFLYALNDNLSATPFVDFLVDNTITNSLVNVGNTVINAAEAAKNVADATVTTAGFMAKVASIAPFIVPIAGLYLGYKFIVAGGGQGITKAVIKRVSK